MAKRAETKKSRSTSRKRKTKPRRRFRPVRLVGFLILRMTTIVILGTLFLVLLFSQVDPPLTHTMWSEKRRLGSIDHEWVPIEEIAPVMARSAVAAEDANYCLHWGFDVEAIQAAIDEGAIRGASTISQQTVKNVFLWQNRSYVRKALETAITPAVEAFWSKERILEVYMNIAEFDEGVFGVEAASRHYFGVAPAALTARQAALLAAVLPNPKDRSASNPSSFVSRRATSIMDGAATIRKDGRSDCFED